MSARCRTKWIRPSRCPRKSRRTGYPRRADGLDLQQHRLTKQNQPGSGDALQGALTTARGRFRQPFAWRFTLRRDRWGSTSDAKSLRASARDFPIIWPDTSGAISERDSKFESVSLLRGVCKLSVPQRGSPRKSKGIGCGTGWFSTPIADLPKDCHHGRKMVNMPTGFPP